MTDQMHVVRTHAHNAAGVEVVVEGENEAESENIIGPSASLNSVKTLPF